MIGRRKACRRASDFRGDFGYGGECASERECSFRYCLTEIKTNKIRLNIEITLPRCGS